jgi:hypothetical protein
MMKNKQLTTRYLGNAAGNGRIALPRYLSTFRWRVGNELTQGSVR